MVCGRKKLFPWSLTEDVFRVTPRKKQSSAIILNVILVEMDEDQWAYYSAMSEEVDMDFQNEEEDCGVNEAHVDCSDAFNTSQWVRTVVHENGFVAVIMRSDTYTGSRGRTSFVLIGCERSGKYKGRKKEFVRKDTGTRKCGCPFKIRGKPVHGGEGWAVKLICGIHNHELAKTLVGHPYAGRLTDDKKNIITDMTKSNVKPRSILLTLKEHNSSSCTTIKQMVESAHWSLKRILQNSVGDLCSVWDAMNNMMTLQHTEIRASFETSTHVVGHVFKKTLYKRLLGMVSMYALNEISVEFERVRHLKDNVSYCGIFRGSAEDKVLPLDDAKDLVEPSSVGSRGRSFRSFFRRNPRKNLPHFFRGSSRSPFPTRGRRFFSWKNLRLQPPAINVVYPKVPTAIYTIHAIETVTSRLED
ncbi:hypothetical protein HKD37_12G034812 [Glycine soja]